MYENAATQENIEMLRRRGVLLVGPTQGRMASGLVGTGRMLEPSELIGYLRQSLGSGGALAGQTVVITAGGTQEPLDPVRMLANRSSGKQGFALAEAARDRGARVVLICAPVSLTTPAGVERVDVATAAEMKAAVLRQAPTAEVILMAAAVADFRPAQASAQKLKRTKSIPEVRLEKTDDILEAVAALRKAGGLPKVVVGFAAESQDLVANAKVKLAAKGLNLIVANDITGPDAGFGADTNRVTLLHASGATEELPLMSKESVAEAVLDRVVQELGKEGQEP
jgi:phosphopantothenoylcysteine decarboxylase/phosphopantothenate--cysteine ligase